MTASDHDATQSLRAARRHLHDAALALDQPGRAGEREAVRAATADVEAVIERLRRRVVVQVGG